VGPQNMNRLRKFFGLPPRERLLLIRAVTLLAVVRIALWLVPFKILQQISAKLVRTYATPLRESHFSTDRVVWAVQVASRYVPRATCLTQALAAQALLGFGGIPASVQIGVAKEMGNFEAHAWLESGGKILMGGAEAAQRYTQLLSFSAGER
jgi:hypothetical protein